MSDSEDEYPVQAQRSDTATVSAEQVNNQIAIYRIDCTVYAIWQQSVLGGCTGGAENQPDRIRLGQTSREDTTSRLMKVVAKGNVELTRRLHVAG